MVTIKSTLRQNKFLLCLLIIAGCLLFKNLDNIYLWQDEAETALLAQNILTYGYPRAWDGQNIITQNAENDFNEHFVWTWSPWLQLYITASSFRVLGENTFAARFPFALIGLISIALFYRLALKLSGSERVAQLSSLLMSTSIPFLLHARQCRWYMLAVFATIWMLHAYVKLQQKEKGGIVHCTVSSVILFYSSYLVFVSTWGGILLHFFYCHLQKLIKPTLRSLVISLLWSLLFIIPWVIYSKAWDKSNPFEEYKLNLLSRIQAIFVNNVISINSFIFPAIFIVGIVWVLAQGKKGSRNSNSNLILLLTILFFTVVLLSFMPWMYFRYLIGLVPPCCLLLGIIINRVMDANKVLACGMLLLLIFTNVFSLTLPPYQLRFDLLNFFYEITHNYDCPNEGIVNYLKEHGTRNQLVITNYGQLPVIFYTGMQAIGFGQNVRTEQKPDWVIIRRYRGHQDYLKYLSRNYQPITIPYPDIPWGNKPDPFYHKYRTAGNEPQVVIYKKP